MRIYESIPRYITNDRGETAVEYTAGPRSIHTDGRKAIRGPADVFKLMREAIPARSPQEHFAVLYLDGRHKLLSWAVVSVGTLTASLVHPREVFSEAVSRRAAAVVLGHNHPSGDPTPSIEDRELTVRLAKGGEILGIPVLDHVVLGGETFSSLQELGAIPKQQSI